MLRYLDYFKKLYSGNTFEVSQGAKPHRLEAGTLSKLRMAVIVMAVPGSVLVKHRGKRVRMPAIRVWCVEGQTHRIPGHPDQVKPKDGITLHCKVYLGSDVMDAMRKFVLAVNQTRAVERIVALEK